ncbi:MAG TPA: hypothetical protein DCZ13_15215 [Porticoccaceae bacterium]|nr:hypothetical protein [Porticoccaceae bacterium]
MTTVRRFTLILALIFIGLPVVLVLPGCARDDEGRLHSSGRIEGRLIKLSAKTAGTVKEVFVDEGDTVQPEQPMAVLKDEALCARAQAQRKSLQAQEQELRALDEELALLRKEVKLQVELAESAKAAAQALVAKTSASLQLAEKEWQRLQTLRERQLVSQQKLDEAELQVVALRNGLQETQANLRQTEKTLSLALLGDTRVSRLEVTREAKRERVEEARLNCEAFDMVVGYLNINSPVSATVLTRNIEVGEEIPAGATTFTLVDMDRLYLKIYVPEPRIGELTLGQSGNVYVDAFPDHAFSARVSKIAQQAEFTPKNVETKEERVKLVFAVELALADNKQRLLKPGMPADAVIDLQQPE